MKADPHALGFDPPSPMYLLGLIVFGIVGYVALGIATILYPYAVTQTWLLWLIGDAATGWI